MSGIFRSQSFTPSNTFIKNQFEEEDQVGTVQNLSGKAVKITRKAHVDLNRLDAFFINDKCIYSDNLQFDEQLEEHDRQSMVFKEIELATGSSEAALGASKLQEQHLIGGIIYEVLRKKKLLVKPAGQEKEELLVIFSTPQKMYRLETTEKNFKIITEATLRYRSLAEINAGQIPQNKYLKIQVILNGSLENLGKQESRGISLKVHFTKEYSTEKEALKAGYFMQKSYLTPQSRDLHYS